MALPLYNCAQPPRLESEGNRGLWYGRYFNHYAENWTIPEDGKRAWVSGNAKIVGQREMLQAYGLRYLTLLEQLGGRCAVFNTDWHFATGLGLPHPVENGLAWHHTLGVPYLTGSGVKGLLKAWINVWDESLTPEQRWDRSYQWLGTQERSGNFLFFDAVPIEPMQLTADVMTPHMGKWYEQGDSIAAYQNEPEKVPADWHDPVPVPFLVVKQARFLFGIAPRKREFAAELDQVMDTLQKALEWLGAGAKTAVGYGRMKQDNNALQALREELQRQSQAEIDARAEAEKQAGLELLPPLEREIERLLAATPSVQRRHVALLKALVEGRWQGDEAIRVASRIRDIMQENKTWRQISEKKNPAKDTNFQDTQTVLTYLQNIPC